MLSASEDRGESASWTLNRPTKFPPIIVATPPGWYDELNGKMGDDAVTFAVCPECLQVLVAFMLGTL
jgi:hypothetical protein